MSEVTEVTAAALPTLSVPGVNEAYLYLRNEQMKQAIDEQSACTFYNKVCRPADAPMLPWDDIKMAKLGLIDRKTCKHTPRPTHLEPIDEAGTICIFLPSKRV